jgi:hypothetical protein
VGPGAPREAEPHDQNAIYQNAHYQNGGARGGEPVIQLGHPEGVAEEVPFRA